MTSVNTQMILDGLKQYALTPDLQEQFDNWKAGGFWDKLRAAFLIVPLLIYKAEAVANDLGLVQAGGSKRDAVVKFLDDAIDTPFWLEPLDGTIIGVAIDAVVGLLNLSVGKAWIDKVKGVFGL